VMVDLKVRLFGSLIEVMLTKYSRWIFHWDCRVKQGSFK
jgi:hypothetical protein